MPATFNRIKNWIAETLNYADLNAEIDNILTNFTPTGVDDYSTNAAQMKLQTSPGGVGTESLAQSLAGEIERLRYMLAQIKGTTYWYSTSSSSLASLAAALEVQVAANRIESGKVRTGSQQPLFLKPNGAALTYSVQGATTNLIFYANNVATTISTDLDSPAVVAAPSSNNTALVNDVGADDGEHTRYLGEYGSSLIIDAAGTEISALVGNLAAFKINNGVDDEYFIARVKSATELTEVRRGFFFNSSNNPVPRITFADNDTLTLLKLGYVFGKTDGTLTTTYNEPIYSGTQPSSPVSGQYWFDFVNIIWKRFDGSDWVDATATFLGWIASDSTNCIAARSYDFNNAYTELSNIYIEKFDDTQVRAKHTDALINVYGTQLKFGNYLPRWDMDFDLESGVTEAAELTYFAYVTEQGVVKISDKAPMDRRGDLRGYYHPHWSWRCVGQFYNNDSSNVEAPISYLDSAEMNFALSHKISGNALYITLHKNPFTAFKLRSSTEASGETYQAAVLPGTKLTISSGSTIGTSDGQDESLIAHIIGYAGRASLAISRCQHSSTALLTTTAEGGAGAADSPVTLYSNVARSSVPGMAIAELQSNQATAGTWASALEVIRVATHGNPIRKTNSVSYVSSDTLVVPAGVTSMEYEGSGAGGGGGGGGAGVGGGGGGGGGAPVFPGTIDVIPNDTLTITIGAAGTAGGGGPQPTGGGSPGGAGGDSTLSGTGVSLHFAGGAKGGGGCGAASTNGGAGGATIYASGGALGPSSAAGGGGGASFYSGGTGSAPAGTATTPLTGAFGGGGGGGGGAGGSTAAAGGRSIYAAGGTGGPSPIGAGGGGGASWGAGGNGGVGNAVAGSAGNGYGSGGGGGASRNAPNVNGVSGGAGAGGKIILRWRVS